jgi:hypothetical protein
VQTLLDTRDIPQILAGNEQHLCRIAQVGYALHRCAWRLYGCRITFRRENLENTAVRIVTVRANTVYNEPRFASDARLRPSGWLRVGIRRRRVMRV